MRTFTHALGGGSVTIRYPEREADLDGFVDWIATGSPELLGFDTETTGLNLYSPGFAVRTAQFGDAEQAWVIRTDLYAEAVKWALRSGHRFTVHNRPFDLLVVDRHLGVPVEELAAVSTDSRILAHLVDPRLPAEGGIGLALKPLAQRYVDADASDGQAELMAEFRKIKATKNTGWAKIDIDNDVYLRYAGLDPILGVRVHGALQTELAGYDLQHLVEFEHALQLVLMRMQRRGFRIDVSYTEGLRAELQAEAGHYRGVAARYGVENINSTKQIAAALSGIGEVLRERTPSGNVKVDKSVLQELADVDSDWQARGTREPNRLAEAVLHAKRAEKWNTAYLGAFLDLRDEEDRLHASIGGLQARTARMSISSPPLQQLPSGEWRIRRAMIADPGHVIVAADYSQVEMRVLAAMCQDPTLLEAINSGTDLHDFTARTVFGEGFTKAQRSIGKAIGFGKVYGGGLATIVRQTGAPRDTVREALGRYDSTFPGIKRYARHLQEASGWGAVPVVTPAGRRLPLDRDRTYAATNYMVQSTARDLLAQALVDIDADGLGEHLLLPVHDEVVAQAPAADAEEVVHAIAERMDRTFSAYPGSPEVPIVSDPDVYGRSWGHGYGAPE